MSGPSDSFKASRQRRGIVNIWFVLVGAVIIGIVGLACDVGFVVFSGQQLQQAADAASLAGARLVRHDAFGVRMAAIRLAGANDVAGWPVLLADNPENISEGDVVIGFYNRQTGVFEPTLTGANAVKVVARRTDGSPGGPLGLLFGPLFNVNTINIKRTAIAMIGGGTGAGLICLNEEDKWTFRLSGNIILDVTDSTNPDGDGAIQINSISPDALKFDGTSATLECSEINVYADEADSPPPEVYDGPVNTSRPRIPDPLADLEPPPLGPDRGVFSVTGGTHTLLPGYYPEGLSMTGGDVTLEPGIYVLSGEGLNVTGGNLIAHGVMFYLLDGGKKCNVNLTGNGTIDIMPIPLDQEPYGGMAIWQDAANQNTATIRGTDQFQGIEGTLYFPTSSIDITGTSDTFGISQLICDSAGISGTGALTIHYDGRFPAPGTRVFLVE